MSNTEHEFSIDRSNPTSGHRLAVLGAGKMGGILVEAFLRQSAERGTALQATVRHADRAETLAKRWGIPVQTDNAAAADAADILLLGVKPAQVEDLVREIRPVLRPEHILISLAASVRTEAIEQAAGEHVPVIRAMPNTPSAVAEGVTALCAGRYADRSAMALAQSLFSVVGRTVVVDERHMDAVTGLSGSGPAFLYIVIEALAEAGVNVGLPREVATLLAAQTTLGSAKMVLETGAHPALLKDAVTTPAGCTVDGILELDAVTRGGICFGSHCLQLMLGITICSCGGFMVRGEGFNGALKINASTGGHIRCDRCRT